MSQQHTSRYCPVTKKDKGVNPEELLKSDAYKNMKENEGMDTHTHGSRYVPVTQKDTRKWVAVPAQPGHSSRYFPVTPKDKELNREDILKCENYKNPRENEGMDTQTHGSRYVPATATSHE
jgi:hypothetical protein